MTERTYIFINNMGHDPLWKGEGTPAAHLDIELTERCNNACIHCCINRPVGDRRSRARELDTRRLEGHPAPGRRVGGDDCSVHRGGAAAAG